MSDCLERYVRWLRRLYTKTSITARAEFEAMGLPQTVTIRGESDFLARCATLDCMASIREPNELAALLHVGRPQYPNAVNGCARQQQYTSPTRDPFLSFDH